MRTSDHIHFNVKINKIAHDNNLPSNSVFQHYALERFLVRVANSTYKNNFILKGGILVSSILGLQNRTTQDIDITLRQIPLRTDSLTSILTDICNINLNDDLSFQLETIESIREDDSYGGLRIKLKIVSNVIDAKIHIDFTTGDVILPGVAEYDFHQLLQPDTFSILGYPIETILAEKIETILKRATTNTRAKDYYDVFCLATARSFDKKQFNRALLATLKHRGSTNLLDNYSNILTEIENSSQMQNIWQRYTIKNAFADAITFKQTIKVIRELLQ